MPHYKCEACRVRVRVLQHPPDSAPEPCPLCDSPMDAVNSLTELVGFRSVEPVNFDLSDYATAVAVALPDPQSER
jgi:hypothetical protein